MPIISYYLSYDRNGACLSAPRTLEDALVLKRKSLYALLAIGDAGSARVCVCYVYMCACVCVRSRVWMYTRARVCRALLTHAVFSPTRKAIGGRKRT